MACGRRGWGRRERERELLDEESVGIIV